MCYKCIRNPRNRNTRYCDDWWDDIPHGGYKGDREWKEEHFREDYGKDDSSLPEDYEL